MYESRVGIGTMKTHCYSSYTQAQTNIQCHVVVHMKNNFSTLYMYVLALFSHFIIAWADVFTTDQKDTFFHNKVVLFMMLPLALQVTKLQMSYQIN